MNKRELKRLSRTELLELLLEINQENDKLRSENERLASALRQRELTLEQAGSIAEAALALNGVFEAAQAAADQYLQSIYAIGEKAEEPDEAEEPENTEG